MQRVHGFLIAFLALATLLAAQGETPDQQGVTGRIKGEAGKVGPKGEKGEIGKALQQLVPAPPPRANGLCHFVAGCQPPRVGPGGTGTVLLTAVLEGDGVLLNPPPMTFVITPQQGPIELGTPLFRPARESRLAAAFRGQLVYDDTAVIEIPFSVARGAAYNTYRAAMEIRFDINSATSGQKLGSFVDHASAEIVVGDPLPVSSSATGDGEAAGHIDVRTSKPERSAAPKQSAPTANVTEPSSRAAGGAASGAAPLAPPSKPGDSAPETPPVEGDGLPWMVAIPAILLVGFAVLLLRLRKH